MQRYPEAIAYVNKLPQFARLIPMLETTERRGIAGVAEATQRRRYCYEQANLPNPIMPVDRFEQPRRCSSKMQGVRTSRA
jgi:hypothetical protein